MIVNFECISSSSKSSNFQNYLRKYACSELPRKVASAALGIEIIFPTPSSHPKKKSKTNSAVTYILVDAFYRATDAKVNMDPSLRSFDDLDNGTILISRSATSSHLLDNTT